MIAANAPHHTSRAEHSTYKVQRQPASNLGMYVKFPDSIEGYHLGTQVGKGAFGQVYQATLKGSNQPHTKVGYAIKIIDKQLIMTAEMIQRVKNEVSIHSTLNHPNILRLFHFFEDDRNVYLITEYCEQGELFKLLKRNGPFSEEQARRFVKDIVHGLAYLHSHGIIHRDLKLSNILLTSNGDSKIADFGLAVRQSNPFHEQKTMCGTPNYLPPEILNKEPYGMAADIWSLGCILYALLIGKPPFESAELKITFERVKQAVFDIPNNVGVAARNLIRCMIVKDPKKRISLDHVLEHPFVIGKRIPAFNDALKNVPISTNRLRPIRQRIKYGEIEIDLQGNVVLRNASDGTIMTVSKGGIQITVGFGNGITERYEYSPALPAAVAKRYELMRKFVQLIQSKTPKVILYTDSFKAYYMESGDFVVYYHKSQQEDKAEYNIRERILRIEPDGYEILDPSLDALDQIDNHYLRKVVLDVMTRYQQCQRVARDLENRQAPETTFPFIIKEGVAPPIHPTDHAQLKRTNIDDKMDAREGGSYRRHIAGTGWCVNWGQERYVLFFDDGSSIDLDGLKNRVTFRSKYDSPEEHYSLDQRLPQHVRLKLIHFPQFMSERAVGIKLGGGIRPDDAQANLRSTLTFGSSFPPAS